MARRPTANVDVAMVARLEEALKEAYYQVEDVSRGRDTGFDLIAYSDHLGRRRSHYIQIKATPGGVGQPVIREFVGRSLNRKSGDEFWLVAPTFTTQAMHLGGEARNVRLFKFDELLRLLRRQRRRPPAPKPKVDRVVRAVSTNKQSLVLMAASVVTMIDEKIEQLKGQKPNDPDRVANYQRQTWEGEWLSWPVSVRADAEKSAKRPSAYNAHVTIQMIKNLYIHVTNLPYEDFATKFRFRRPDGSSLGVIRIWPFDGTSIVWPQKPLLDNDAMMAAEAVFRRLIRNDDAARRLAGS